MTSDLPVPTASETGVLSPSNKRVWAIEAVCLYLLTFGNSIVASFWLLVSGYAVRLDTQSPQALDIRTLAQVVSEVAALAFFWALMQRRGGWQVLTKRPEGRDIARGIGLWIATTGAFYLLFYALSALRAWQGAPRLATQQNIGGFSLAHHGGVGATALVLLAFVNPVCEECIARAWTQFHLERLCRWRPWYAAALAAILQAAYRLYQGVIYAVLYTVVFAGFGLYYARTRRLAPVILAHLITDVWALSVTFTARR